MKKVILLITTCLVAVSALMFVIPNASTLNEEKEGKKENGKNETREILGTLAWWNNVRSSGESGFFDPNDMKPIASRAG